MSSKILLTVFLALFFVGCSSTQPKPYRSADLRQLPCHWFKDDPSNKYHEGRIRARKFANEIDIYAIAAHKAYEDGPKVVEEIPFPKSEVWLELDAGNRVEDATGFAAKSWVRSKTDGHSELVIAFRGTDSFRKDFFNANFVFAKGIFGRTQFESALEYIHDVMQEALDRHDIQKIIFTGHSLGGGLAEYVQRLTPNSQAISFDASPNQGRLYSLFSKTEDSDSIRVYERGEILSYLRFVLSPDITFNESPDEEGVKAIWYDFYRNNPITAHDMYGLAVSLVKVSASTGKPESLSVLRQLEAKRKKEDLYPLECEGGIPIHRKKIRNRG